MYIMITGSIAGILKNDRPHVFMWHYFSTILQLTIIKVGAFIQQ